MQKNLATALLAILVGGTALGGVAAPARAADDLQIAAAGALTGPAAALGDQQKRGTEQAVKDINAKGGILGHKLVLTMADDACDPKQAVSVANQLVSKGVVFVDGHLCSGSAIPASAVYADAGVIMITPSATAPALTEAAAKSGWNNVYRACGRDDQQGIVSGDYLVEHFKDKPVAIIDDKSAYGKGVADATRATFTAAGGKVGVSEEIVAGEKDFSALITKMKQANVGAIYYGGYEAEAGLLVRQAREQGLKVQFVGTDALAANDFWSITGATGDGVIFTFSPDPTKRPDAKMVVDELEKSGPKPEGFVLYSYAAVQIYAQAAEQAKSTKFDDVVKALHSNTFDTVVGPIKYDAKGDIASGGFVLWTWHDGHYAELAAK